MSDGLGERSSGTNALVIHLDLRAAGPRRSREALFKWGLR